MITLSLLLLAQTAAQPYSQTSAVSKAQPKASHYSRMPSRAPAGKSTRAQAAQHHRSIVIAPVEKPDPKTLGTSFKLTAADKKLLLQFESSDPNIQLNSHMPINVQLYPDENLTIHPQSITSESWPKGQNRMWLTYTGDLTKPHQLDGEALYYACEKASKKCKRIRSKFSAVLKN